MPFEQMRTNRAARSFIVTGLVAAGALGFGRGAPAGPRFATVAAERAFALPGLFSGYTAGQNDSQNREFTAVQADVTVPAAKGCFNSSNNEVMFVWIGLGGTDGGNDLAQEGIECNDNGPAAGNAARGTNLPDLGGFHPFYEFAGTQYPRRLCGDSMAISGPTILHEYLSYQARTDTAHFFMKNINNGTVLANCSVTAPTSSGWRFDGNTADYIVETYTTEALSNTIVRFSTVGFYNARAEWSATRTWVPFGSRPTTKRYGGQSRSNYCAYPSGIGRDKQSFTVRYSRGDCAIP